MRIQDMYAGKHRLPPTQPCPLCKGSGTDQDGRTCGVCHGDGKI